MAIEIIEEEHLAFDHPYLAMCYSSLGEVECALGNLTEAKQYLEKSIEIFETSFELFERDTESFEGFDYYKNLFDRNRHKLVQRHSDLYSNLGIFERDIGNFAEAKRLIECAIEIDEKHFDSEHPTMATNYSNLGNAERGLGNLEEAKRLLMIFRK